MLSAGEFGWTTDTLVLKIGDGSTAWVSLPALISPLRPDAVYGSGSDGNVTISSTTNLTRDMHYQNLTVDSGQVLNTNGFRVFVRGSLSGTGTIANDGTDGAAVTTAGSGATSGYLGGGTNGGAGAAAAGAAGAAISNFRGLGSVGGAGGAGTGGAGGAAGTLSAATAGQIGGLPSNASLNVASVLVARSMFDNSTPRSWQGGTGGGGGGGNGSSAGAGGGGGGGINTVFAFDVNGFTGTISARGGAGGSPTGLNRGGGGGGGGGLVVLVTDSSSLSLSLNANGGLGGTALAGGINGTNGTNGFTETMTRA